MRPLLGIIVSLVSIFCRRTNVPFSTTSVESAIVCLPPHGETDLDHGQHSAFFKFANNYWCRAGDPCEGKSLGRHAVCSLRTSPA
jgi:hypothetical protein